MAIFARIAVALALLAMSAFCAFGFLATYEPPGSPLLRILFGAVGLMGLVGAGRVLFRRTTAELNAVPDRRGRSAE